MSQKKPDVKKQPKRQPCQIYSRVVGFITPTSQWNGAKQAEFEDRVTYDGNLPQG